ncbi:ATP-binding protein [Spirochaeta isovalerica]|uniref:MinD superfamily P-loop ATPase n=1 Tax=Spirochaeta isovalerica TaxID=150 RepID=A0A841REI0_9SPIO|nr:ATP-binding protein [Spirochaeta isovalerica]MBB6481791.1 MinD superfamily P-loop ATPase [Spirochaeta isovalerica]
MKVKEIVVISGKGGTGKTTFTASLAPFLKDVVIADCDVDAPDLHILLNPRIEEESIFSGSAKARIDEDLCTRCNLCAEHCRFGAIDKTPRINPMKCEGCGVCEYICPADAITLKDVTTGKVYKGITEYGPMVHARLVPGEETSGKLVSRVRNEAKKRAESEEKPYVLIDGSPGIGCNVISSITGASTVVIVTEPTLSGLHDLKRVLEVAARFSGKAYVVINKYDLSREMSEKIEIEAEKSGAPVLMKLPFDKKIVQAVTGKKIPSLAEEELFLSAGWKNLLKTLTAE